MASLGLLADFELSLRVPASAAEIPGGGEHALAIDAGGAPADEPRRAVKLPKRCERTALQRQYLAARVGEGKALAHRQRSLRA